LGIGGGLFLLVERDLPGGIGGGRFFRSIIKGGGTTSGFFGGVKEELKGY
jgi:hypothetical protein